MAVKVIIKRTIRQGHQARELVPLLLQLRCLAAKQPGYISGETLCDLDDPGDCLVISKWESAGEWKRWKESKERTEFDKKIESLTGEGTKYNIYEHMTPREDEQKLY